MRREDSLSKLNRPDDQPWDVAVIGGGAVGAGIALDAAARGLSCVLFEQHDFCKGTSSRSTKLIHGGVRYLAQGNVSLVREALHERGLLQQNAPELVRPLRFVVPCASVWGRWYYWLGMKCYDLLAGRLRIGRSRGMSTQEVRQALPGLGYDNLRGGVSYFDAQFDDARLLIGVLQKARELGALPLNYMRVTEILKRDQRIRGLRVTDEETGQHYVVACRTLVNAAGVFSDDVRRMDNVDAPEMIAPSQGIHLVVHRRFLGGNDALMIPKTEDGRVLFAIPWLGRAILGTTDTPIEQASLEPKPLKDEVDYLLTHFSPYLDPSPTHEDVLSVFAGLRPLVRPKQEIGSTSKISREHRIIKSASGLISILGGKWTTFRKMSEDVVDVVQEVSGSEVTRSGTRTIAIDIPAGSTEETVDEMPTADEIRRAIDQEFARTVEDVLARRFRCLLLDAKRSKTYARPVAQLIADVVGHDGDWVDSQVYAYSKVADSYMLSPNETFQQK